MSRSMRTVLLALAGIGTLGADTILWYVPGTQAGTFTMNPDETRETLFQSLSGVALTEVGADIDPASSTAQFRWRIFNSDSSFTFGSVVLDATVIYTDVGLAIYRTAVSVPLTSGNYYILSLQALAVSADMRRYNEVNQGLPLTTSDGNFKVIDGKALGGENSILPAFVVTTGQAAAVPEPGSAVLLAAGLALLGWWRRGTAV